MCNLGSREVNRNPQSTGTTSLPLSVAACLVAALLRQCGDVATAALLVLYLSYINTHLRPISPITVGVIGTGFYLSSMILPPVFGRLSDRVGRKPFIVVGLVVGLVVVQVYPLTTGPVFFFALLSIEGIGNAIETPATLGFLSDSTVARPRQRGKIMAFYEIISMVSLGVGYLLGGTAWDQLGVNGFRVISLVYLAGIFIIALGLRNPPPTMVSPERSRRVPWRQSRRLIAILPALLAVGVVIGAWFAQASFLMSGEPQAIGQRLMGGFSGTMIGLLLVAFAAIFAIGAYSWGIASSRLGRTHILIVALLGLFGLFGGLYWWNNFSSSAITSGFMVEQFLFLVFLVGCIFAASGFTPVALTYLVELSEEYELGRGVVMGFYALVTGLGRIAGSWMSGFAVRAGGFNGLIVLSVAFVAIAAGFVVASASSWRLNKGG